MPNGGPLSEEQLALEEALAAPDPLLVTTPEMALTGEIRGPAPGMIVAPAPAIAAPPAAPLTAEQRVTGALGGPAALQIPQTWQAGAAPEFAVPAGALRTATGGELQPSALPRVSAVPEGMQVTQYGPPGAAAAPPGAPAAAGPESDLVARARAQGGDRAAQLVQQMQAQGVPDATIRARLGMAPAAGGVGVMRGPAPEPPLPGELQRPYETLYPPDYASRVAAAAVAGDITNEQAKKMMAGFEEWQKSPLGRGAAEAERQRGVAEQMGDLEQQRLAAQQAAAQRTQAMLEQQRATQEAEANAQRAWREDYDREMVDQTAKYERAMEEAKRARIDPDRARIPIVDALAAAMGQFAATMTGTPNAALQIINQRLDRDVAAQEREIKTLEGAVAERRNRLGLLRQRFGDREMAMAAEKRLQLEQVATELNRIATTSEIEQNRVGAQKLGLALQDQIESMKAQEQMGHAIESQNRATQRQMMRIAAANQLAKLRAAQEGQQALAAQGLAGYRPLKKDEAQRVIPGVGLALPGSKVQDLRDEAAKFQGSLRNIETMDRILAKYRGSDLIMSEDDKAAYRRAAAQVDVPTINALAGASMTEGEMARIQPLLAPQATDAIGRQRFDMQRAMTGYKNQLQGSFREKMGAHIERPLGVGVNPETGNREYMVSEGVMSPEQTKTGAGGATVLPGTAPP